MACPIHVAKADAAAEPQKLQNLQDEFAGAFDEVRNTRGKKQKRLLLFGACLGILLSF